jgi:hypothetical protein
MVWGSGLRIEGSELRVEGIGFGFKCRVQE